MHLRPCCKPYSLIAGIFHKRRCKEHLMRRSCRLSRATFADATRVAAFCRGYMANFLSRCRPDCPIFAFTGVPASCQPVKTPVLAAESICNLSLPICLFDGHTTETSNRAQIQKILLFT